MYEARYVTKDIESRCRKNKKNDGKSLRHAKLPPWKMEAAMSFLALLRKYIFGDVFDKEDHHLIDCNKSDVS